MAQHVYECMFIFDSNAYARDPQGVSARVTKLVEECGGEVLAGRLWFEQKLAYPIDGQRKGAYWLSFFRMEGQRIAEFNRACQLESSILRSLTLKVEPRMVELRVSQASGQPVAEPEPEPVETAEASPPTETAAPETAAPETAAPETAAPETGDAADHPPA